MPTVEFLENGNVKISFPIRLRECAGRRRVVNLEAAEQPADPIVQNIVRGFRWQQMIDEGIFRNAFELSEAMGKDHSYVARILRLALLCPEIIHAALTGTLPGDVSLLTLRSALVDDWKKQKKIVGMK